MQRFFAIWTLITAATLAAISGCGGGSTSPALAPSVPLNYLAKYQGTWIQQCATPIHYGGTSYGPSSSRKKFVISPPNTEGKVIIDAIEDYFDTGLGCHDYTSLPKVSVKDTIATTASFARLESLFHVAGNADFDVLNLSQPQSAVVATGSGYSSVIIAGVPKFRINFSNGEALDIDAITPAFKGEYPFFLGGFNGTGNALYPYAERDTGPYIRQ